MKAMKAMKVIIVAAIGNSNQLGKENKLLWKNSADLAFFKELTLDSTIIMGRKTFDSLPGILPRRKHLVISRNDNSKNNISEETVFYKSLLYAIEECRTNNLDKVFIIGGAEIYKEALNNDTVQEMYITNIDYSGEADVFFPQIVTDNWECTKLSINDLNVTYYKRVDL